MGPSLLVKLVAIALCACFVVSVPLNANAGPRPKVDTPERRLAAAEFKRGKQLYAAGDYGGALESFQNGFDAYPLRGFLVNIGQCHRRLGHLKEAATAYQQFLDGADVSSTLRTEVEEALAEVRQAQKEAGEPSPDGPRPASPVATPTSPMQPAPSDTVAGGASLSTEIKKSPAKKKSRAWVWALVGVGSVLVVGGVTAGVVLGVRGASPSGGSLGTIDGRSP
jgi:tetratricopeptide (TPR) repeat protein